jgi:hypothetical protein
MSKSIVKAVALLAASPRLQKEDLLTEVDLRVSLIQALISLGLQAVEDLLQEAVVRLAGPRYGRKGQDQPYRRWGGQPGSVYLADQKLPLHVPRVRNLSTHTEVPLHSYHRLQIPRKMDEGLLRRVLQGIACRQ